MKHFFLSPLGKNISIASIALTLFGCTSTVNHALYAVNNETNNPIIEVVRDNKKVERTGFDGIEECRTNFYINKTKVGGFSISDSTQYQLAPGHYKFTVDNCQGRCSKYGLDVEIKQGESRKFTLSADATGKPFIIVNQ